MGTTRSCIVCGKELSHLQRRYCSAECRATAKRARMRAAYKPVGRPGLYRDKVCPDCGEEFRGHIKTVRCAACQKEADKAADRKAKRNKAAGKTRALGSTDKCVRCGAEYTVNGGRQKYCPDCAIPADREHHAKRMREINASIERRKIIADRKNIRKLQ